MGWVIPPHVCEREDGHYGPGHVWDGPADEDCVWCSGLMLYLARFPGAKPATLTEAEALRFASGDSMQGGSNANDLIAGYKARYGWTEPVVVANSATVLLRALTPGKGAVALGKLSHFPAGHRLRRFIPGWEGGHAVYVSNVGDPTRLWWMDPEGPETGYQGEWVTPAELTTFVGSYSNHVVASIAPEDEVLTITDRTPKQVTTKAGAVYYDPGTGAKVTQAGSTTVRISPYATAVGRCVDVFRSATNTYQLLAVKSGDPAVTIEPAPDVTEQQLAAARAAGFAQGKEKASQAVASITL